MIDTKAALERALELARAALLDAKDHPSAALVGFALGFVLGAVML